MELLPSAHVDTFCRDHLPPADQWPELTFDLPELRYPARLNAATALGDDAWAERLARMPVTFDDVDTSSDDVCMLAFTSGTTGRPKATMHFHRDVLSICETFSRHVLRPAPDDVFTGTPPYAFTFGLGG